MMNILGHQDKRRYNPSRDFAHCWPGVMEDVLTRLDEVNWDPALRDYMKHHGVGMPEIEQAAEAYMNYFAILNNPSRAPRDVREALDAAGFFKCHPAAHMALAYCTFQYTTGMWWTAIEDTMEEGKPPVDDRKIIESVREHARRMNSWKAWRFFRRCWLTVRYGWKFSRPKT